MPPKSEPKGGRAGPDRPAAARNRPSELRTPPRTGRGPSGGAGRPRAAIYLRVSTDGQSLDPQRAEVLRLVHARGFELVETFEESSSSARERAQFRAMHAAAARRSFDVLVFWALDRFGRSMSKNLADVLELDRLGVQLVSVCEPWLDTGGPVRDLLVAIFSWVAEQERRRLVERTHAGLDRARARGVKLGRPKRRLDLRPARKLQKEGLSVRQIATRLRLPESTLRRALGPDLLAGAKRLPEFGTVPVCSYCDRAAVWQMKDGTARCTRHLHGEGSLTRGQERALPVKRGKET